MLAGGLALAKQVLGKPGIAVAGFGDGTAARGTFHETLIQASAWKLPLLYFCENNGWAVGTPFSATSPTQTVAERASAYGIPGEVVDGQDPVAVYAAVRRARAAHRGRQWPRHGRGADLPASAATTSATSATTDRRMSSTTTAIRWRCSPATSTQEGPSEISHAARASSSERRRRPSPARIPTPDIIFKNLYAE